MKKIYLNTLTPEEIIKRFKNGDVAKYECEDDDPREAMLIDGFIVKKYLARGKSVFEISSGIYIDENDDYYFEEQEEFKVEKTGKYKTRDGRIAYVSYIEENCVGCIDGYDDLVRWSIEGIPFYKDHDCDLVEYVGD